MKKNNEKMNLEWMNIRQMKKALLVKNLCSFLEPMDHFLFKAMSILLRFGGRNERCTQARLSR
ncbi:MAG: hypothetical protein ACK5MK_12600 [Dysgonomonas sp.]